MLAQSLFPVLLFIIESIKGGDRVMILKPDWTQFSYSWTCVIIFVITFCMTASRNLAIFVKINSFGVIFVGIVLAFICGMGFFGFTNTEYVFNKENYDEYHQEYLDHPEETGYEALILLSNSKYPALMGILGGGYYFHNISLPVIRNSRDPSKNTRDVFLGYFMVFLTYFMCGVLGYFGFTGYYFRQKDPSFVGMEQNCLNMFDIKSAPGTFVRLCCFCQLLTVNALLFACERS
jgi:Na+/proline symporter